MKSDKKLMNILAAVLLSLFIVVGAGCFLSGCIAFFSAPSLVPDRMDFIRKISVFLMLGGIALFFVGLIPVLMIWHEAVHGSES